MSSQTQDHGCGDVRGGPQQGSTDLISLGLASSTSFCYTLLVRQSPRSRRSQRLDRVLRDMSICCWNFINEMMCADAGFHADQARWNIREPRFHLTTRPLLPQCDCAPVIETHDVERVLADVDADHGNLSVEFLRHGVLLALVAPIPALLAGGAGARPDHSITRHGTGCRRRGRLA